ncbi:hypothetical protein POKO110462_12620 [Pontibacter korlensis]|uniref:Outer membrane protein beta-barrel domain-containing protein n=1 Tax=Pontibacter korlensis TaxID=400092 RepID=A0A0E3ZCG2_9BACT|nr:hypothetical protein [Pontibacter korlensis]AKD02550.1 hypothetical protein PKOR_04690 [Pontibacter korlensis]
MRFSTALVHKACMLVLLLVSVVSCTAPRAVINSGKVTATGKFKVGLNFGGNIATEPIGQLDDIGKAAVDAIAKRDSVYYDDEVEAATKAMLAYSLDPVGPTFDFYIRYGIARRVDVGYKYASGVHVFDTQYQFLGPTGTPDNPGIGAEAGEWYGSVGLQYAGQSSEWIDKLFLDKLQPLLQFTAKRRDVTVPIIFSKSFGVEEEKGSVAFGAVYNYTSVKYGFEPGRLFQKYGTEVEKVNPLMEKNSFGSFGLFVNAKLGFKYIYILPAITMYYQNYGSYKLLNSSSYSFSGFTFIPSIGLQASFGKGK